ncbi:rubrerythrin [Serratia sp. PL17]|uniref:terminase small subunit n=1 Tax=Serratia sp. PL17 TaxID=2806582 RepID=UPI001AE20979|nr:terminase small subunit [Serratia sp. PL17]MBP1129374.1 rubrerythrin [Serratia sp. PL17]
MSKPDEKAIERDFCAGELSLQAVADKHGITIKALRYMAGKYGWKRTKGARAKTGQKNGAKKSSAPKKTPQKNLQDNDDQSRQRGQITNEEKEPGDDFDLVLDPHEFGLTEKEALFAYGCAKTNSRIGGYRFAGYSDNKKTAYVEASRLYRKPNIARAIREIKNRMRKRYTADLDEIVDQLVAITRADPNVLTQYRRVNCRHCWGENNLYQWRDIQEYDRAAAKAMKDGRSEPDYGGLGFVTNADPNPDCPRCNGEGEGDLLIGDTRDLDANEHAYFLGVKQTKNGIELLTEDKKSARQMLIQLMQPKGGKAAAESNEGGEPQIIINLVNSPDGD